MVDPKLGTIIDTVIDWFRHHGRDLPWRHEDTTPWAVLVSEVMLQQTPVVRVLPRWTDWMQRWPTPADLADAPTAEVLRAWDRLGYPRRALRLQDCAQTIVREHGGVVPRGIEALRALPGIGEYTAAAVTAFAHHERAVVVDTNIRRVLARSVQGLALPAPSYSAAERALATRTLPPAASSIRRLEPGCDGARGARVHGQVATMRAVPAGRGRVRVGGRGQPGGARGVPASPGLRGHRSTAAGTDHGCAAT